MLDRDRILLSVPRHDLPEHILAGRIHQVEQDDDEGDEREITVGGDELEAALLAEALLGVLVFRRAARAGFRAGIDEVGNDDANPEHRRGDEQELEKTERTHQPTGDLGADDSAERAAEGDEAEQAPALLLAVEVVGEAPELRDDEDVEDSDPEIKRNRDRSLQLRQQIENDQISNEEQRHPGDQADAVHLAREKTV